MISFGPYRGLEEHDLLEIHIRTGQHHVPGGAADFHPPFPVGGKIRRGLPARQTPVYLLERFQGGAHSLWPLIPAARPSIRRQFIGAPDDFLSRSRKIPRRAVYAQTECLKYEIALQRSFRFQRKAFRYPAGCIGSRSNTLVGVSHCNESPRSDAAHEWVVVLQQCGALLGELPPAGIVRQPAATDLGGDYIQQLGAEGSRLDGLLRRQGVQHRHRVGG